MPYQPPIPASYTAMDPVETADRIRAHKKRFGRRLVILGHHYQQDDVLQFADFTGDSLKLSQIAAEQEGAEFVLFCGVHFMAESADILTDDSVKVILPDLSAGCSMADMAAIDQVEEAWDFLTAATPEKIVPITYVNSAASVKAFCGAHDGACCTSGNARMVLEWAFRQGEKVLFLPDQHLGRNTAYAMGISLADMALYDPHEPDGGLTAGEVVAAKVVLWKGHCSVHQLFTPAQCDEIRARDPECRILVHPECDWAVVEKADLAGSTEYILRAVEGSPPQARWAIGTEVHLVERLAAQHPDKTVRSLAPMQCLCTTMYRISPPHVLWSLDRLAAGEVVNRISVDPRTKRLALIALDRMLANVSPEPATAK
ncbi:MAG: quinolinate synthase NadA [Phycisphaerales bacterium]|nr:MAG: quinolinate synthase NadA [Phycisphaerales bacterium]